MIANFCSLRCASKASINFFSLLLDFIDRRFILIADFSNLSVWFFLLIKLKTFTFSLKGNTLWLIFGRSELPLYFEALIK